MKLGNTVLRLSTNSAVMAMRRTFKLSRHTLVAASTSVSHSLELTYPETQVTTLGNNLCVVTEPSTVGSSDTVSVGVCIDAAGSRFETEEANGVAHFLQRCIISSKNINNNNMINGYTSKEHTAYYVQGSDNVPKALDILSDVLQNPAFEETLVNRERAFILRQMEQKGSEQVMLDHLHAVAFQGSPLGRTILGAAENIKKITKKDIQDYFSTHYAPHRMVITAHGPALKHDDVVDQVNKLFTKLPLNPVTTKQLLEKQPAIFTGSEIRMRDDDSSLAHFAVAFKGASWTDPDFVVVMLIQAMIGSWNKTAEHNTNYLTRKVRLDEIAESMTAFNTNYKDTGLFGVYGVAAKPDCCEKMAYEIMEGICGRLGCPVSDDLLRAKNQLKSSLLLSTHGTSAAEDIGRQFVTFGCRVPIAELFSRIDAVDVATFQRVALRFIFDQDIAVVASGPIKLLPDYNYLRSRTYKFHAYITKDRFIGKGGL